MARLIEQLPLQSEAWDHLQRLRTLGKIPHALALCGSAHSGQVDFAWAFTQALVCEASESPCGQCGPCVRVEKHQSESVLFIEAEKGVIKLESAERIGPFLSLQRLTKVRVILVPEAQGMNMQSTNAILKLVEEPPPQTYFIFVTPEVGQLLPTLRSRLQVVRLKAPAREPSEDPENLRAHVLQFLSQCLRRESGAVRTLFEVVGDRQAAEQATSVMQNLLRDWSVVGTGAEIHQELIGELNSWPQWPSHGKVKLWRMAKQMETDLYSNVDRSLVFENFYLQVPRAMD